MSKTILDESSGGAARQKFLLKKFVEVKASIAGSGSLYLSTVCMFLFEGGVSEDVPCFFMCIFLIGAHTCPCTRTRACGVAKIPSLKCWLICTSMQLW